MRPSVETDNAFPGIFAAKNVSSTVFPVYASFFILISFRGANKKRFGKRGKKGRVKGIPRFSVDQTNRVGLCVHLSLAQLRLFLFTTLRKGRRDRERRPRGSRRSPPFFAALSPSPNLFPPLFILFCPVSILFFLFCTFSSSILSRSLSLPFPLFALFPEHGRKPVPTREPSRAERATLL